MASWRQINKRRRRYIKFIEISFSKVVRSVRKSYISEIIRYDDPELALNQISESEVKQQIKSAMIKTYQAVGVAFAKYQYNQLEKSIKPEMETKNADDRLESLWMEQFLLYVERQTGQKITSITRSLLDDIENITRAAVREGGEEGWGVRRVAQQIQRNLSVRDNYRVMRIARTEVVGASNAGMYEGARSHPVKTLKKWQVNLDSDTRDDHADMADAEPVKHDEPFSVGGEQLMYPGDPAGSAWNVINCRCSVEYIPENDIIDDILNDRMQNVNIY